MLQEGNHLCDYCSSFWSYFTNNYLNYGIDQRVDNCAKTLTIDIEEF